MNCSNALTGFFVSIAFWVSNSSIRKRWYNLMVHRKFDIDNDATVIINNTDELTRNSIDDYRNSNNVSLIDRSSSNSNSIHIHNSNSIISSDLHSNSIFTSDSGMVALSINRITETH